MKLHQIPSIHGLVMRWKHHSDKPASGDAHSPERRPSPMVTPPSPKSPSKRSVQISEPDIVRVDKGKRRKTEAASAPPVPTLPSPPPSPPAPRISLRPRPASKCSSGEPTSHPELGESFQRYGPVSIHETFECTDAVDPVRLLTLSRKELLSETRARGGNALADEVWEYTVSKKGKTGYVVKVEYTACAVLMKGEGVADPQKPVAIDIAKTKGVNGLMTVTSRH